MKTPYKYLIAACSVGLICSCSDESIRNGIEDDSVQLPITLFAAYPTATRASDAGFEDADRMGVYVLDYVGGNPQSIVDDDAHASNVRFSFNEADNTWKSASSIYWTSKDTPADIIGYYPYVSDMQDAKSYTFSIQRRQDITGSESEMGGYEASDFLWAKSQKTMPTDSRVDLTFRHMMAGVRVTLSEGKGFGVGEWSGLEKSVLIPNIKSSVDIDLETGSLGSAYGDVVSVVSFQNGEDWRAVVVPQTITAGSNVIDITVDGVSYHLTKSESLSFAEGKLNTFTITVDKRTDGSGYEFSLTDEAITAWIDDVQFRDGIVRDYISIEVSKRGSLKNSMIEKGLVPSSITGLKLIGEINEEDFKFLREECLSLKAINLYECIVWDEERKHVIPEKAFYEKSTLLHVVLPKQLEIIGGGAFCRSGLMGTLILPDGLKKIGEYSYVNGEFNDGAFRGCESLSGTLQLPSSLIYIEDCAFRATNMRGAINFSENLIHIGTAAFADNKFSGEINLPENLEYLGKMAFANNDFSGNCIIPRKIRTIQPSTFYNSGFDGTLYLHDGITEVGENAFLGCGLKGELKLPSSLAIIGEKAFLGTKFSSIVFPKNLSSIGGGAFAYCEYLTGTIEIPQKVSRINDYLFFGCSRLNEVIFHKDVTVVGAAILSECHSLNSIVCDAVEPPVLHGCDRRYIFYWDDYRTLPLTAESFDGIAKDNFILKVPRNSVALYKVTSGWNEFRRISESSEFICRPLSVCALNNEHRESLIINSNCEWEVIEKPEWCNLSAESGNNKTEIYLTIRRLLKGEENRQGKIVFRQKDSDIITECSVSQFDYTYDEDECITLQKASKGNGIDILFVGDGWDASSIAKGQYLDLVNDQMDAFFGVEPYLTYRDRFNVYACVSLSQEVGVNTPDTWRNTRFKTFYSFDKNSLYLQDDNTVFDYAVAHSPITKDMMSKSIIIVSLNNNEYGSATTLTETGSAISLCCSSPGTYPMDTRGIIQHEACGHAFGKLADERIVTNRYISEGEKNKIAECQGHGWYRNISLTGKLSEVWWSDFIFDPRYSDAVDVFEGAYGKTRGVYRAEINSCMNYGIPYFSAPARLDIMRRILEYSGEGFTMEKFYATDSDKWGATGSTRAAMPDASDAYVNSGMHHPVRIVKSKKY